MVSINVIGAGLIQGYENFVKKSDLTAQNMFQMLSIELGGDGEKITKQQLDNYIKDAKSGIIDISDRELNALIILQNNWDTIAGKGNDCITFENMKNYISLLVSIIIGGIKTKEERSAEKMEEYEEFYGLSKLNDSGNAEDSLNSVLSLILPGSTQSQDIKNKNLIDMFKNLISLNSSPSTVEAEA